MKVCRDCLRCYDDIVASCVFQEHSALSQTRAFSCEIIAGYRLESVIECGPQSEIYRARQIECGRTCLITIRTTDATGADRFLIEAQAAAMLFQPGVTDIYESGALENGEVFAVTEDIEGQTLREFLDKNAVPPLLETVNIIRQTAEALHAVHKKGLLHRAVRPENIVLTTGPGGELLVRVQHLDLGGLAQHSTVSNKFLIDSALDTLRYFAPEQSAGEETTARTDVYSLGIVFYEMLTGSPPFDDTKATGLIAKHRNQPPPDVKIDDFELRMLVTHALFESLQKRPDARQSTADLLARQLRHIEQLATHVSTPPPAGSSPVPPTPIMAPSHTNITTPTFASARNVNEQPPAGYASAAVAPALEPNLSVVTEFEPQPRPLPSESKAPAVHNPAPCEAKRSRLKLHRKKSHSVHIPGRKPEREMPEIAEAARSESAGAISFTPSASSYQSSPTKITWDQPDDDIPTLEDVVLVLATEQIIETDLYEPKPESRTYALGHALGEARRIEWEIPDDDIPTLEDVMTALARDGETDVSFADLEIKETCADHTFTDAIEANRTVSTRTRAQTDELPHHDLNQDKIGVVEAPSRVEINIEQPVISPAFRSFSTYSPDRPDEADQFHAFRVGAKADTGLDNSVFAAYTKAPHAAGSFRFRAIMIGAGFAALLGFFLFGYDIVNQNVQVAGKKDTLAASSTTEQSATQRIEQTAADTQRQPSELTPIEETLPKFDPGDVPADPIRTKPVTVKETSRPKIEKPLSTTNRVTTKTTLEPSTLVITSEKGAIRTWTEPSKRSTQSSGKAGVTRPRFVANPMP